MTRGLFVSAEVAWSFVTRLVRSGSVGVLLLLSRVRRRRHRNRRRRIGHIRRHLVLRHGLLHRRMAEAVHIGDVRRLHLADIGRVSIPATTRAVVRPKSRVVASCRRLRLGGCFGGKKAVSRLPGWYVVWSYTAEAPLA